MIQTSIGILTGMGIFLILADLFRIPYFKTSKAFQNLIKRQRKKTSTIELWLQDLAQFIGKLLKLNEYTSNKFDARIQLISDLQTAGMEISPELHIAGAIIKAGICGLLAIPAFFIFPLITPVIIALAFAMYFKEAKGIQSRIKKRREAIEYELPRFVFFIAKTLVHSRDVLSLLDNYRSNLGLDLKTAGAVFKYELNITVADMRSGNYESALTRLESRVGSSMLSDVVRGLISILRGDNTAVYWQALSIKFSDIQRQLLKQQAQKVPGRVKRLSMILLFCFMAVYIVVIITEIMTSLGAMFG